MRDPAEDHLSDVDNIRGYELTITGSGFNDGTTASAYVLQAASAPGLPLRRASR